MILTVVSSAIHMSVAKRRPRGSRTEAHRSLTTSFPLAFLHGLDRAAKETGLPVAMAEDPLSTVVLGAGKMLSNFELLRKISLD